MKLWWRKGDRQSADEDVAADPSLPVIRLERVGKTFKGDGDEETEALADITVYQGSPKAGKVLGTFATKREARAFAREHKGYGESMVNNKTGRPCMGDDDSSLFYVHPPVRR